MNVLRTVAFVVLGVVLIVGIVFAAQEASIDKGKALFNDPNLGTNGKTCNTCHPDGKGLEKAGAMSDLENMINGCIKSSIKGKALDAKSMEIQSITLYIKNLSAKKSAVTKKPAVGC
jgi:cytochrome c peroxidase